MPLRVVAIVKGHGEDEGAIRHLLTRIWYDLLGGDFIDIIPWRAKQGQILNASMLPNIVEAAAITLHGSDDEDTGRLLLILIDSEGECPAKLAGKILDCATKARSDTEIACVMPNPMFETWFAAAADSLRGKNGLPNDLPKPDDPEGEGTGKGWIKKHLNRKYKETVDQSRFVDHMDLKECLESSRSFRKLCKELERFLPQRQRKEKSPRKPRRPPKGKG